MFPVERKNEDEEDDELEATVDLAQLVLVTGLGPLGKSRTYWEQQVTPSFFSRLAVREVQKMLHQLSMNWKAYKPT